MALIKCPECGKEISDRSSVCIHCGYPISAVLEHEEKRNLTSDKKEIKINEFGVDAEKNNGNAKDYSIGATKKLKLSKKILIISVAIFSLVFVALIWFGNSQQNNELTDHDNNSSSDVSADASDENGNNDVFVTPEIQYDFIDYTEFSTYWFDGVFRCGTDFLAGDYYILPLFGAGAMYEVADMPNDFSWSYYRLLRKISVNEGEYVNVAHGSIMVPADEVDVNNWTKYGVFLVGKDISAGEYKMETLTDKYQSNLYGITGISGAYQINDGDVESTPTDSNYLFDSQKYITLKNGQYIIITNIKLTNVNATSADANFNDESEIDNKDTTDVSYPDNAEVTDTTSPDNESPKSFISNGCFTFSARSFIKLFDETDKEASGYNYTYMRMNEEELLFYELAEISGGYENVKSVGMVSFDKGNDTTLTIEEDYTENIITKINVLVENVDDVPPILVGCMCVVDPALDFASAYNLGMDVVERAGTEEGYTYNDVNYVVVADDEYYFIIISVDNSQGSDGVTTDTITDSSACSHSWLSATCTTPLICEKCGLTEGEPKGHHWWYEDGTRICAECSLEEVVETATAPISCNHSWYHATCTTPQTCEKCGLTEGEPNGHWWYEATCTEGRICTVCLAADPNSNPLGHSYVQGSCVRCGESDPNVSEP